MPEINIEYTYILSLLDGHILAGAIIPAYEMNHIYSVLIYELTYNIERNKLITYINYFI